MQTWTWGQQLEYSTLFDFMQTKVEKVRTGVITYLTPMNSHVQIFSYAIKGLTIFVFCRIFRHEGPQEDFI